ATKSTGVLTMDLERCDQVVRDLSADPARLGVLELMSEALRVCGGFVELDCLTAIVARVKGIEDVVPQSLDGEGTASNEELVWSKPSQHVVLEYNQLLRELWTGIGQMPLRHRVALLLNLKSPNGINVITLFPATGVASLEELSCALEMTPDE